MLNFTTDQWAIIGLIFVLGLLVGGFLFSGGGRKWKTRYNAEVDRRRELERLHAEHEKEWREKESLHAAALKDRRDHVVAPADPVVGDDIRRTRDPIPVVDRNN